MPITLTAIGQSVLIQTDQPTSKLTALTGFTYSVLGETGSRFVTITFRYSIDTINWSNWQPLTVPNLTAITLDPTQDFNIEYTVTRAGTDNTGTLTFQWINLATTYDTTPDAEIIQNSVFARLIDKSDETHIRWYTNVLNKLYQPGIVSKSLIRGKTHNENGEDRDYIDFWRSLTHYFSLLVIYTRKFENLKDYKSLLESYLNVKGIFNHDHQQLIDSQFIMAKTLTNFNERGSIREMYPRETSDGVFQKPHGELLRMISFDPDTDEFLFSMKRRTSGWNLNNTSPFYKLVSNQEDLTKAYKISDLSIGQTFPLINQANCSYVTEGDDKVIRINYKASDIAGIGTTNPLFNLNLMRNVSPNVCYEMSFKAKVSSTNVRITAAIYGFDALNNVIDPTCIDILSVGNVALSKVRLPVVNTYYNVRIILYPSEQVYVNDDAIIRTNLNIGSNLVSNELTTKIMPRLVLDNSANDSVGSLFIKDFAFKVCKTNYGKGYLNGLDIAEFWIKNNSSQYNNNDVEQNIRKFLIPYRAALQINNI